VIVRTRHYVVAGAVPSLSCRFADVEVRLGVHGTDLQAEQVKGGAESRVFGLEMW
jgi:hypothetical protein